MLNKLEFEVTMKVMGIDKPEWHGIILPFNSKEYNIVTGKIPYVVAKRLEKKYPNKQKHNKIRQKKYYYKNDELMTYITRYVVDSKEELVSLLLDTQNYYKKTKTKEKDIVSKANKVLIDVIDPYENTQQWLNKNDMMNSNNKDVYDVSKFVDEFDLIVNPFCGDEIKLKDIDEYIENTSLMFSKEQDNQKFTMRIYNKHGSVEYIKSCESENNYLDYLIKYNDNTDCFYKVEHYISKEKNENSIAVSFYNLKDDCYQPFEEDIKYDLISGLAFKKDEIIGKPITLGQKQLLIIRLLEAMSVGTKITLDNMTKENKKIYLKK